MWPGVARFIDQEYARYNFRGFDIGNHFCECAIYADTYTHLNHAYSTKHNATQSTVPQQHNARQFNKITNRTHHSVTAQCARTRHQLTPYTCDRR